MIRKTGGGVVGNMLLALVGGAADQCRELNQLLSIPSQDLFQCFPREQLCSQGSTLYISAAFIGQAALVTGITLLGWKKDPMSQLVYVTL